MTAPDDEQIRNLLLQSAYDQRSMGYLNDVQLSRRTVLPLRKNNLEHHLLILCDRKLLERKTESKTVQLPFKIQGKTQRRITKVLYRLTSKGESFVESGFIMPEIEPPRDRITVADSPGAMVMINSPAGQQINYVSSLNLQDQINELKLIVAQMQDSQDKENSTAWTEALEQECSKESPNRPLLVLILKALEALPTLTGAVEAIKQILGI